MPVAGGNSAGGVGAGPSVPQRAQRKRRLVIGRSAIPCAGELLERCLTPAIAAQAVELQRVIAREQVGDGVQVDGGGHRRPSVRSMRAQGVSLASLGKP